MRRIHLILVALRNLGSECHRTVANAARLARALGADLELFHAIDVPRYVDTVTGGESWLERAQADSQARCSRKLERIAARLRECGLQVGTTVEWDHPAHEAIIRHGERVGADLIVAERSGAHHVAPALLHPTEWELLRLSPVPLLLASAGTPAYRRPVMVAAVDPARAHSKPAALDEEILQAAGTLKRALGARLHVVHAYGLVSMGMPLEMQAAPYVIADAETVTAAEAQEGLDRLLSSCGISVTRSHVVGTSAKDAIRDLVRSTHSSIIVMGAVPRRGIAGLLLGNTAERVLAALNCDVLIVKPPEFRSQVQRAPRAARSIPAPAFP